MDKADTQAEYLDSEITKLKEDLDSVRFALPLFLEQVESLLVEAKSLRGHIRSAIACLGSPEGEATTEPTAVPKFKVESGSIVHGAAIVFGKAILARQAYERHRGGLAAFQKYGGSLMACIGCDMEGRCEVGDPLRMEAEEAEAMALKLTKWLEAED